MDKENEIVDYTVRGEPVYRMPQKGAGIAGRWYLMSPELSEKMRLNKEEHSPRCVQ